MNNLAGNLDFARDRQRLHSQLERRLQEIGDYSELMERDMVSEFNPGGIVPLTSSPTFDVTGGVLEVETHAASIGYRVNDGPWLLYFKPLGVEPGDRVTTKAIRYGWQESEAAEYLVP